MISADKSSAPARHHHRTVMVPGVPDEPPSAMPPAVQIMHCLQLARACAQNGQHHHGREAAERVLQLTADGRGARWRIEALGLLSLHLTRLGHLADAIPPGLEAVSQLDYVKDAAARAEVLCTVAMACNELGLSHDGLKYALEALAAARISNDPVMLSWALNRAGICTFFATGDFEQSNALLEQAAQLARECGHVVALCSAINNLGANYRTVGLRSRLAAAPTQTENDLLQQSRVYFQEAMRLAYESENIHLQTAASIYLAEILTDLADYPAALAQLEQGWQQARQYHFQSLQRSAELVRATIYHRTGDLAAAVALLETLAQLPSEQIEYEMMVLVHEELYRVFKDNGQFEQALWRLESLRQIEQTMADTRSSTQGWAIRKELEITNAQLETEREKLNAERERLRAARLESEKQFAEQRMDELEREIMVDSLTTVGNRRLLDREGPRRMAALDGGELGMAIVVLDLDHFKEINDRFGHATGDETLCKVAQLIKLHIRGADLVVRYGGEEFVLLLDNTTQEQAQLACERLRLALSDYDWHTLRPQLGVSASLGVFWLNEAQPWPDALRTADIALYQAKRSGRNRVQLARQLC